MKSKKKKLRIAIFYPWIKSKGGSEKVLLEIMNLQEFDFDLYTWIYDEKNSFEEFKNHKINILGHKIFHRLSKTKILRGFFLLLSFFSKIPLEKYDYFLIYTSGVGEFITFRNYKKGKTIAYVNTILRDAYPEIIQWNLKNRYKKFISKLIYSLSVKAYNIFEKIAWKRIDYPVFISEEGLYRAKTKGLLKGKKSKVVYVPVNLKKFQELPERKGEFFFYLSRINNPKRQDLLIRAWKKFSKEYPDEKLVISGGFENEKYFNYIKQLSKNSKNIEIKAGLSNKEILELYSRSKAVLFVPFIEDFGIVPFEALAAGKPIIAVDRGGYFNLIKDIPQYYTIKEESDQEKFVKNIVKSLKDFMKSKKKPKKIDTPELSIQNFKKNMEDIFK